MRKALYGVLIMANEITQGRLARSQITDQRDVRLQLRCGQLFREADILDPDRYMIQADGVPSDDVQG